MTGDREVSICIGLFKPSLDYLRRQAVSIAQNAGVVGEIVLADDSPGLGLGTEVIRIYKRLIPTVGVRYLTRSGPAGMIANWNFACRQAEGSLLLNLGQDDMLEAGALRRFVDLAEANPTAVYVAGGRRLIDDRGAPLIGTTHANDREFLFEPERLYRLTFADALCLVLRNGQILGEPSCVLMRRDQWLASGGYDPLFQHAADLDLLLRMLSRAPGLYLSRILTLRRIHSGNLTKRHIAARVASHDRHAMYARYSGSTDVTPRQRRRWISYLCTHDFRDAIGSLETNSYRQAAAAALAGWRCFTQCGPRPVLEQLAEALRHRNFDAAFAAGLLVDGVS